jgi:small subunit ribosomal protein S9
MEQAVYSATGRRKDATARVQIKPGKGVFTINGRSVADYLTRPTLVQIAQRPLEVTENLGKFDVACRTSGGGLSGQAGAIKLGVSRALLAVDPQLRAPLRREGLLTRDPREVERKKYGQPKARKRFQYSKR